MNVPVPFELSEVLAFVKASVGFPTEELFDCTKVDIIINGKQQEKRTSAID